MTLCPFRLPRLDSIGEVSRNEGHVNIGGRLKFYQITEGALGKFLHDQMALLFGEELIGHRVFDDISERVGVHFLQNSRLMGADCFYTQMQFLGDF